MKYKIKEYPGYFGSNKDNLYKDWNEKYKSWKIKWEFENKLVNFDEIFWKIYVAGYTNYFLNNHEEAEFITQTYSYAYDKDLITKENAFIYKFLLNKPGLSNQFHHCALNYALKYNLNLEFKGVNPIQVRGGESKGFKWNPGFIPCTSNFSKKQIKGWWNQGSVESYYQSHKVLLAID